MQAINFKRSLLLFFLVVPGSFTTAAESQWELKKDAEGIQVFTRDVEGSSYDAVRVETVLQNVRLSSLVALIEDVEACPDWADRCAESYVVEQVAANESYVYTHNDMPFPVKDRDVVAHVVWSQYADSLVVEMNSRAVAGKHAEVRGRLRLREAMAQWRFEPLVDGSVRVANEAHINPGSALPGWLTNMLLVDTPFETMKSFRAEVQTSKYQDAEVSFVLEP